MEQKVIEIAARQGAWTVLSIVLIFYILKNQERRDQQQEEREIKYQNIILNLTEKLSLIDEIREDVLEIKKSILTRRD